MIGFGIGLLSAIVGFVLVLAVLWGVCNIVQWLITRDEDR